MKRKILIFILFLILLFSIYMLINYFVYIPIKIHKDFKSFLLDYNNIEVEVLTRMIDFQTGKPIYTTVYTIEDSNIKKQFFDLVGNVKIRKFDAQTTLGAHYNIKLTNINTNQQLMLNINSTTIFINDSVYSTNLNLYLLLRDNIFHRDYMPG